MAELNNRQWLLAARPQGMIKESDFRWNETTVPALRDGQILVRNLAFSFDPTQRGWMSMDTYMPAIPLGQTMKAGTVGQVVDSKRPGFAKGDLVQGLFGWEDYTVNGGEGLMGLQKLPRGTDPILALSLLGTTGLTAYFGTLAVGAVKAGDTFVVSGAAGATGSVSGMIAKIKGCRVVGIAGGREKCDWLLKEAGFDAAIDYKSENVGEALTKYCPKGIDVYFDNVGGEILDHALARIANGARVVLCGAISQYNNLGERTPVGPKNYFNLILHGARMEGFLVFHFLPRYPEAIAEMSKWYAEGKLKNQVDLQHGLENAPKTIIRLFTGANFGKQLLKLGDPQ
ncbi:MAG TPA: NADP-dependent oxidoreductase [Candidatus Binatus sp.]|uniref:NADP-dependent oxidoreductase n=1 Tax=Candidatus Binatus sp. TaxID=2811406 RepID=UPI002B47D83F|nr:NADP-dependent oxidoreductase [Candidatus Binatus sp.]HKN14770.1 NADP-dependent oxidoreductase [Candidatus Binatus sp.]